MAILFTKELKSTDLLSAFNNNLVEFASNTVKTAVKCEIDLGEVTLNITPDPSGSFSFNYKEIVKTMINQNNFKDSILPNLQVDGYVYQDGDLWKQIDATYTITFDDATTESVNRTMYFIKAVRQPVQYYALSSNSFRILTQFMTGSTISHYQPYYEGVPCDVSLWSETARSVTVHNRTNGQQTTIDVVKGVNRLFLSDGGSNVTFDDILPLAYGLNDLEFEYSTGKFRTLFIEKFESGCGKYLKFMNKYGSFAWMKFERVFKSNVRTKTRSTMAIDFDDIESTYTTDQITGKDSSTELTLFAEKLNENQFKSFLDLVDSPLVELWMEDTFIQQKDSSLRGVVVRDSSYNYDNKRNLYNVSLRIGFSNNTF